MYFEFESMDATSSPSPPSGLSRRHRRLSSSSQSLRELVDAENVLENITPSHCDLYLITRKKLSQINANAIKQSPDLRREVLLTSIHRTITSKSTLPEVMGRRASEPSLSTTLSTAGHKSMTTDCPPIESSHSDQRFKYVNMSSTTSTSTTTMAMSSSSTRSTTTSSTSVKMTPSTIKKRNLSPNPLPYSDFEGDNDWKSTIKRVKVGHGSDALDVSMESELDSGFCDKDLNDLTNNFHSLKTPFT